MANNNKNKLSKGHWRTRNNFKLNPKKYLGFIYIIRHKENGNFYVGRKQFITKQGDPFGEYTGSSHVLNDEIEHYGKEAFDFCIIEQYERMGALMYAEAWTQMYFKTPENSKSFNRDVARIRGKIRAKITPAHERYVGFYKNRWLKQKDEKPMRNTRKRK